MQNDHITNALASLTVYFAIAAIFAKCLGVWWWNYIMTTMEILTYGKENESFSKLMSDIEDIIWVQFSKG